jgi:hypothetical protein
METEVNQSNHNEVSRYQRVTLSCEVDGAKTLGFAFRRDLEKSERMTRAARVLGICWGVAVITVFVPILHFILVPGFLILGCVLGVTTWMETGEVLKGEISCPNCKKAVELVKGSEEWPKTMRCPGCSYTLTIKQETGSGTAPA